MTPWGVCYYNGTKFIGSSCGEHYGARNIRSLVPRYAVTPSLLKSLLLLLLLFELDYIISFKKGANCNTRFDPWLNKKQAKCQRFCKKKGITVTWNLNLTVKLCACITMISREILLWIYTVLALFNTVEEGLLRKPPCAAPVILAQASYLGRPFI